MNGHDPSFDEDGHPTAATSTPGDDEIDRALGWAEFREGLEVYAPDAADGRAQALYAGLAIILAAPTAKTARIRAELLRHVAEGGRGETLSQLAQRLRVTPRRLQQVRAEIFKFRMR